MDIGIGVPPPPKSFVGRQQELEYLGGWLRPGRSLALVAEAGTTGVGRTSLARAFAHETRAFKGVLGWTLQADGPRPHAALRRWALRLGAPIRGRISLGQLLAEISTALRAAGPVLVVIDGVRERDVSVVRRVITALPSDACVLYTIDDLKAADRIGARTLEIAPLGDDEGIELLEAVIGSAVPSIIAGAMLQAVGYLPLGVVLAGSRLRQATGEESGSWGGEVDPRRAARLGGPIGVARSFLDAYRRLGEGTARVLRATGLFQHGPIHAERLSALLGLDLKVATTELERLAGYGIIEPLDTGAWMSHALVSGYAYRLLEESGELDRLQKRSLSLVLQSEGAPGGGLTPSDILDVVHRSIERGDLEDMTALATRIGDELASWCLEGALALVGEARERAQATRNRALGILKTRHEALLESAASLGVKDEDVRLDGSEPDEEVFDVRPVNAPAPAPAKAGGRSDDAVADPLTEELGGFAPAPAPAAEPVRAPVTPDEPTFAAVVPTPKPPAADAWWVVRPDTAEAAAAKKASEDWSTPPRVSSASQNQLRAAVDEVERNPVAPDPSGAQDEQEKTVGRPVRAFQRGAPDGPDDARMYGAAKHAATLRGDSTEQVRADCLVRARAASSSAADIQDRLSLRLEEGERDLRGRQDPVLRAPIDRITVLTRSVVDQVRAARASIAVIEHAGDLERMRRAAERAERARDVSVEAVEEADALWTAFYDSLSNLQESAARRRAAVQRARNDVAAARTAMDEATHRVNAWRSVDTTADWSQVDVLLTKATEAFARAEVASATLESGGDPETASSVASDARRDAERFAREATSLGNRVVETSREIKRTREVQREVADHVDRIDRDAISFDALRDELLVRMAGSTDDAAAGLSRRIDALTTRVHRGRRFASSQGNANVDADGTERLAATARDVGACLAEIQRLATEVDAWVKSRGSAEVDSARFELIAESLTQLAMMESTGAVARRASSRAYGAAAGVDDAEVGRLVGQLESAEVALRDALESARGAVDAIESAQSKVGAEAAAQSANAVMDVAVVHADRVRSTAETLIQAADARRASLLDMLREDGRALAERVLQSTVDVTRVSDEANVLGSSAGAGGTPWLEAISAALARATDAREAVQEGERRLRHYGDPGVLTRVVDAMQDASDVSSAAVIEVEVARAKLRSLAGRAATEARAEVKTEPMFESDERTDPTVILSPMSERTLTSITVARISELDGLDEDVSVALPAGSRVEATLPVVEVTAGRGGASELTVPSVTSNLPLGEEAYWVDEHTSELEFAPVITPAVVAAAPAVAEPALDDEDGMTVVDKPVEVDFDEFDMMEAPVTDADRAEAEAAVAWAKVRAARARSSFDGARRALTVSSDLAVWASLVEGRSMMAAEASRLDDVIDSVHGRLACAHRVSFLAEAVIRLASEFRPGPLPPEVRRDLRERAVRPVQTYDPAVVRDLAAWDVAVDAWSAGWTERSVLDARDTARVAIAVARRARPGDRTAAHGAARDAVDALAAALREAARVRDAAWSDVNARGAGHARAAWAALRVEDLSGALEQARAAAQISAAPEVRVTASLVLRALGRVHEAEACLEGVDHPLAARVRSLDAGPLPVEPVHRSVLAAVEARDAIH